MSVASNRTGLAFLTQFDTVAPLDVVSQVPGQFFAISGTKVSAIPTIDGVSAKLTAANTQNWQWPSSPSTSLVGPMTLLWRGIFATVADYRNIACKTDNDGGGSSEFDSYVDGTGAINFGRGNASGPRIFGAAAGLTAGVITTLCFSCSSNLSEIAPTIVVNGISQTVTPVFGGTTGPVAASSTGVSIGVRTPSGGVVMDGTVRLFALWNRGMTVQEQINLTRDPFGELGLAPQRLQHFADLIAPPPPTGAGNLLLMGVGGMVAPSVGQVLTGAAGKLLVDNPIVTRRRLITGGQEGDD